MKFSKRSIILSIVLIVLLILVARLSYDIGQHNARLTITPTTPLQLAEAMQSDKFYSTYQQTLLLMLGTVQSIVRQGNDSIVEFNVTKTPTTLGKVTCTLNDQADIHVGDTIRVLTVAHDAIRKNSADVFMPHCYVLKI